MTEIAVVKPTTYMYLTENHDEKKSKTHKKCVIKQKRKPEDCQN